MACEYCPGATKTGRFTNMNTNINKPVVSMFNHRFSIVNGRMSTVRDPRPIEMQGLISKFRIKPWTNPEERSYLMADVKAAQSSLKNIA